MAIFRRRQLVLSFATLALFALLSSVSALGFNPARQLSERAVMERRRLGGLGSSPPSCRSKCGSCAPCKAVHVSIQPGIRMPLEYYPEAWRCNCGNNLFMP
ncbi:EPIDERMAL PATTERNING FACTOR-like protein 4 [Salvia hispanica]|uniref:EPIDERMAL PATTERNING FACTOR-like protein 4 n=1 Tax=Salvia hispanica TaxID=49212 RepID=UPI0020094E98|nr:EPIDERMAL PATTERNING FACTOR-like protein 4 [Salvia hispanica]